MSFAAGTKLTPAEIVAPAGEMRRNCWLSLSFANLVYLRAWSDLGQVRRADLYFRKTLPGIHSYLAIASDVLALSLLTFLLICIALKLPGWLQRALPIVAIAIVALAIRSVGAEGTDFLRSGLFRLLPPKLLFPLAALLAALLVGLTFKFSSLTVRVARVAALAAAPCLAVTFIGSLFYLRSQAPLPPDPPFARRQAGSPPVRVLWILFDEWDQRRAFGNRTPGQSLPVLDRLASQSFTATHALAVEGGKVPVSQMATTRALPSLLYGKLLTGSEIEDAKTRRVVFADGTSTVFGGGDSIFAQVQSHGWNAAAAGWYLPYCRVFAAQLIDCYWDQKYEQASSAHSAIPEAAIDETRMLFETSMFSAFGTSLVASRHRAEYETLLAAARRYAADATIGLAFIHFNIPHTPYFYKAKIGRSGAADYDDALQLVDRSVGDILSSLRLAGLDSKTAIILSSDHPARFFTSVDGRQDPHVPFIVHLPGEAAGVVTDQEFSTVGTAGLALAITEGKVQALSDIENFLGVSRGPGERAAGILKYAKR
jgi:hypothetical protein